MPNEYSIILKTVTQVQVKHNGILLIKQNQNHFTPISTANDEKTKHLDLLKKSHKPNQSTNDVQLNEPPPLLEWISLKIFHRLTEIIFQVVFYFAFLRMANVFIKQFKCLIAMF